MHFIWKVIHCAKGRRFGWCFWLHRANLRIVISLFPIAFLFSLYQTGRLFETYLTCFSSLLPSSPVGIVTFLSADADYDQKVSDNHASKSFNSWRSLSWNQHVKETIYVLLSAAVIRDVYQPGSTVRFQSEPTTINRVQMAFGERRNPMHNRQNP